MPCTDSFTYSLQRQNKFAVSVQKLEYVILLLISLPYSGKRQKRPVSQHFCSPFHPKIHSWLAQIIQKFAISFTFTEEINANIM